MVILIRTHTKKYTKGDSIKKFFAGYVGWLTRIICTKIGDNWTNGTGNIDWFVFPTLSLLENKVRKNVFSAQKWLIWAENKRIFPGGMNKITFHQLNQRFSVSISVRRELPIAWKRHLNIILSPLNLVKKVKQCIKSLIPSHERDFTRPRRSHLIENEDATFKSNSS